MPAAKSQRSLDEIAHLAEGVFDAQVRQALRPDDDGKFVAIDVDSGDYEIDEDDHTAVAHLRARKPAAEIWLLCAGYPTTYRIGEIR
jgi:hypothetical protein